MKLNLIVITVLAFLLGIASDSFAAGYLLELTSKTNCYNDGSDTHGSVEDTEEKLEELYNKTLGSMPSDVLEKLVSLGVDIKNGKNLAVYIVGRRSQGYYDIVLARAGFTNGTLKLNFSIEGTITSPQRDSTGENQKRIGAARKIFKVWVTNSQKISAASINKVEFFMTGQEEPFSTWNKGE